jgi:hypothetical protein
MGASLAGTRADRKELSWAERTDDLRAACWGGYLAAWKDMQRADQMAQRRAAQMGVSKVAHSAVPWAAWKVCSTAVRWDEKRAARRDFHSAAYLGNTSVVRMVWTMAAPTAGRTVADWGDLMASCWADL